MKDKPENFEINEKLKLWILMNQTAELLSKARNIELAQIGIGMRQASILFLIEMIASKGKPTTVKEISRWSTLELHSLSELITRMEKKGLVNKLHQPGGIQITLTEKGHFALKKSMNQGSTHAAFSVLSPTQLKQFSEIILLVRDQALQLIDEYRTLPFP